MGLASCFQELEDLSPGKTASAQSWKVVAVSGVGFSDLPSRSFEAAKSFSGAPDQHLPATTSLSSVESVVYAFQSTRKALQASSQQVANGLRLVRT